MRSAAVLVLACVGTAAAASWHLLDSDISTVDTGVAFVSDTVGYSAATANGAGPEILKTTNGGTNWTACEASFGLDLLLLDIDATEAGSIVVASIFGELYSTNDGASFTASIGGGTSQSVRYVGLDSNKNEVFGVTGQYGKIEGVGISTDGGALFKTYDAKLTTEARYGAFPATNTWYVAAGEWPSSGDDDAAPAGTTGRVNIPKRFRKSALQRADGSFPRNLGEVAPPAPACCYKAEITGTTDGGATFTTLFNSTGEFYFNSIDCSPSNPSKCCAVGEGFPDGSSCGSRIHCTLDGGSTWNRTYWSPCTSSAQYSMMELRYVSDNEVWAVGSELTSIFASAQFLHSLDGGNTWTQATTKPLEGFSPLGLSVLPDGTAFAALDNTITQTSAIAVYN